ncbi:MAG: HDOD domain-containing protein [Desulfobacterales bacterium]|nr:HDOD domain-containing protein [Desulfobacterales bacterium]
MRKILFVDDDPNILQALKRMLRPMRSEWDMNFINNGESALELMNSEVFDVIVTDIQMPGMDGASLLDKVKQKHPETVRIVLSGQASKEMVMKSVGVSHQFLSKPCDAEALKSSITCACTLRNFIKNMESIPSLPSIYSEINDALKSEDVSMQKIGKIIAKDVGMTAKMLHLVNSAFFGLRSPVSSPEKAVSILGLDIIKSLVLSIHIFSQFNKKKFKQNFFEWLWKHSMMTGAIAKSIAKHENKPLSIIDYSFTAGLLHDLGKLLLAVNRPDEYAEVIRLNKEENILAYKSEMSLIGVTHFDVGAYLLGFWGLPSPIVQAVALHHTPFKIIDKDFTPLTAVHFANAFLHAHEKGIEIQEESIFDQNYMSFISLEKLLPTWIDIAKELVNGEPNGKKN